MNPFNNAGNYGAQSIGNANTATNNLNDSRMVLDPRQQQELLQRAANDEAAKQQAMQRENMGFGAQLANDIRNQNTTRQMALAAQQNAAANVTNHLNQLAQARSTNANMIQGALSGGANIN
jgi:gamma-glutamylcysteine synthetase